MLLCFLLDLRSLPSALFTDLKQSLLQLADLYAAGSVGMGRGLQTEEAMVLPDRIGLCYIQWNESSPPSSELKVAYKPGGSFRLRDFHQAVNNLPMKFPTESCPLTPTTCDNEVVVSIRKLLSDEFLYMWDDKDMLKKVIVTATPAFLSSEALQNISNDAATKQVSIEVVMLEKEAILDDGPSQMHSRSIDIFDQNYSCVIHRHISGTWILSGLIKRLLQHLRNDGEGLQAIIVFKHAIWGSSNQIFCKLFASTDMIVDGFTSCKTCRCHGCPISDACNKRKKIVCPVTCLELVKSDLIEDVVRVGRNTLLFMPSFESSSKLQRITGLFTLNVIKRTNLASLNEGVIMGTSYIVTPVNNCKEAASNEQEMNAHIFQGLCESLFHLDQGLVCSSSCNLETMTNGSFISFYILLPSEHGPMLLRRLAGSEEILPISTQMKQTVLSEEIKSSIQACLNKVELRDYNPLEHERGLYPQLNWLVKESRQFGSLPASIEPTPKPQTSIQKEGTPNPNQDENPFPCITDEWEQLLIVDDINDGFNGDITSAPKPYNKALDERTCSILERLEAPKTSNFASVNVVCEEKKNNVMKLDASCCSQPLRPSFRRPKRKLI